MKYRNQANENADDINSVEPSKPYIQSRDQSTSLHSNVPDELLLNEFKAHAAIIGTGLITLEQLVEAQGVDDTFKPIILAIVNPQSSKKKIDTSSYCLIEGVLFHVGRDRKTGQVSQKICLPDVYIPRIVITEHYQRGHSTKYQIFETINTHFYSRFLLKRIEQLIGPCQFCLYARADRIQKQRLHSDYDIVSQPRICWSTDLSQGLTVTENGNTALQIFVDQFSGYTILCPLKTKGQDELMANFINYVIKPFGPCLALRSDRETGIIKSQKFQNYCSDNGIFLLSTAPSSPETNGQCERLLALSKERLRAVSAASDNYEWDQHLNIIQQTMNNTRNTYGFTAQEILFGYISPTSYDILMFKKPLTESYDEYLATLKANLNVVHSNVQARREAKRRLNEATQNRKRVFHTFEKDDIVTSKNLVISAPTGLKMRHTGPHQVLEVSRTKQTASIQNLLNDKTSKAHVSNLRHMKYQPHHTLLNDHWSDALVRHHRQHTR